MASTLLKDVPELNEERLLTLLQGALGEELAIAPLGDSTEGQALVRYVENLWSYSQLVFKLQSSPQPKGTWRFETSRRKTPKSHGARKSSQKKRTQA